LSTPSSLPGPDENVKRNRTVFGPSKRAAKKRRRRAEKNKSKPVLSARTERKRPPSKPKALLRKECVPAILSSSDTGRRVYLARARFVNRRTGKSYPGLDLLEETLTCSILHGKSRNAGNRWLNKWERARAKQRSADRRDIIARVDEECSEEGLLKEVMIKHGDYEFAGTLFTLPDGEIHTVPLKNARPDTFFEIPAPFFELGAGLIWPCKGCGARPLSEYALPLYVALASEQDLLRLGGVDPKVLSFCDGALLLGAILADWDPTLVATSLVELQDKNLALRRPGTISAIDGHLIRWGFHAGHLDEHNVELITIRTK
jgi:hypothetical protein